MVTVQKNKKVVLLFTAGALFFLLPAIPGSLSKADPPLTELTIWAPLLTGAACMAMAQSNLEKNQLTAKIVFVLAYLLWLAFGYGVIYFSAMMVVL